MTATTRRRLALVAGLVGFVLIVIAIVYFAVQAKSLPGFMGQVDGATGHRTKRGVAALVLGALSLLVAGVLFRSPASPGADRAGPSSS